MTTASFYLLPPEILHWCNAADKNCLNLVRSPSVICWLVLGTFQQIRTEKSRLGDHLKPFKTRGSYLSCFKVRPNVVSKSLRVRSFMSLFTEWHACVLRDSARDPVTVSLCVNANEGERVLPRRTDECLNRRHCSVLKIRGMTCEGRIMYCLE